MSNTDKKLVELKSLVEGAEISLQQARQILDNLVGGEVAHDVASQAKVAGSISQSEEGQVIEGIFDGQNMVGPDGKKYSVPANYASKSKMIEGDGLKLTITTDGSFVYKQINPLERDRLTGKLAIDEETGDFRVLVDGKSYKVLTASITYFKGEVGNSATILVPKDKESEWAAVENIFSIDEGSIPPEASLEQGTATEENKEQAEAVVEKSGLPEEIKTEETDAKLSEASVAADEPEKNEFLTPEAPSAEPATAEPIPEESEAVAPSAPANPEPVFGQPKDIFAASNAVDVSDVSQVDNKPVDNEANAVPQANDGLGGGDRQGLEDI